MKSHTPNMLYFGCAEINACCLLWYEQLIFVILQAAEWVVDLIFDSNC